MKDENIMTEMENSSMRFPVLYYAAEASSAENQKNFLCARASEFGALILAAIFGEVSGSGVWRIGSVLALFFFLTALVVRVSGIGDRAERRWYDARAAAESVKSFSWQYAVGGGAFCISDETSDARLAESLNDVLSTLPELDIPASPGEHSTVTPEMSKLRNSERVYRARTYARDRVEDQVAWYGKKAIWNKEQARLWRNILVAVEFVAVLLGFLRLVELFDVNWLGIFAAGAAGIAAWQQTKNYSLLSESYAVTSHEVALVQESLDGQVEEARWAEAVRNAEAAFSREHTLWLARRLESKLHRRGGLT